jgi:uncharacterized protein YndB with AHSA1/START domain
MSNRTIQKSIEINASPDKVWRVFADPEITKEMGGKYATDWKEGNSIGWQGLDGTMITNGTILEVEPGKLLKHNLFSPDYKGIVTSVITYQLHENNGQTTLFAVEELTDDITDAEYNAASAGWDAALVLVKKIAEQL